MNIDIMWRRHVIVTSGEGPYADEVTYAISDLTYDQIEGDFETKTVYLGGRVLPEENRTKCCGFTVATWIGSWTQMLGRNRCPKNMRNIFWTRI